MKLRKQQIESEEDSKWLAQEEKQLFAAVKQTSISDNDNDHVTQNYQYSKLNNSNFENSWINSIINIYRCSIKAFQKF